MEVMLFILIEKGCYYRTRVQLGDRETDGVGTGQNEPSSF